MGQDPDNPEGLKSGDEVVELPITLLYVDNCEACDVAKPRIIEFCEQRGIPLSVRKPRIVETQFLAKSLGKIPRFPTLLVPLDPVVVVCGQAASNWLDENEKQVCDAYRVSNRSNHDPDQGVA